MFTMCTRNHGWYYDAYMTKAYLTHSGHCVCVHNTHKRHVGSRDQTQPNTKEGWQTGN